MQFSDSAVRVTIDRCRNLISCPGVEIRGLITANVPRKSQRGNLAYEQYSFCPLVSSQIPVGRETALWEIVDLVLENYDGKKIEILDVFPKKEQSTVSTIRQIMALRPLLQVLICVHFRLL